MSFKPLPIQHFQYIFLNKLTEEFDVPIRHINNKMGVLLRHCDHVEIKTAADLKRCICKGGSFMYNKLIESLLQAPRITGGEGPYPLLAHCLKDHKVKELFRFIWLFVEHHQISEICRGDTLHTNYEKCRKAGLKQRPSIEECDGPYAGRSILVIESLCSCNIYNRDYMAMVDKTTNPNTRFLIYGSCKCCEYLHLDH